MISITALALIYPFNVLCWILEPRKTNLDNLNRDNTACEYVLGILTIPEHFHLRKFARESWIKELPKNVCYLYLYDKQRYIAANEAYDGISLNSSYTGRAVRFGEKLFLFYQYVYKNINLKYVKFIVKMDDDVVLCPKKLFEYLKAENMSLTVYAGWLHTFREPQFKYYKVGMLKRADEFFVILGVRLIERIATTIYCNDTNRALCGSKSQLFDTNYGGTSLGVWLSDMKDLQIIPLNKIVPSRGHIHDMGRYFIYHPTKTVNIAKERYDAC